jgi:PAS domain S-box-containing protein
LEVHFFSEPLQSVAVFLQIELCGPAKEKSQDHAARKNENCGKTAGNLLPWIRQPMTAYAELPRLRRNRTSAQLASAIVCVIGCLGLLGWVLSMQFLRSVAPGLAVMKPNVALGLTLCGAALSLLSRKSNPKWARQLATSMSILVISLGALSLAEYVFNWDFGIDQRLLHDVPGTAGTSHPGRLAPATALCFVLMGSALFAASLSIPTRLRLPLVAGLSATLMLIGALALAGFVLETLLGPSWNYMGMTISDVLSAMGFMFLGSGLLTLVRSQGALTWLLDRLTTAGFAIGILLMVEAAAVAFNFTKRMLETSNWVTHRQEVLKEIQQVMTGIEELASGERVYIIVGDEPLLKDRQSTKAAVYQNVRNVRKLTADNPNQQRNLDRLEPLIAQRINWEDQMITVRREQGLSAAAQQLAGGPGLKLSDEIFRVSKEIEDEEYRLLGTDRTKAEVASTMTFLLLPVGVFLSLTILSLGVFFLNAGVGERAQAETALRESEAQLHTVVENLDEGVVVSDLNGQLLQWNRAALKLHGYSDSDQGRRRFTELIDTFELSTLHGAQVPVEQWPLARILRGEKLHDLELRVRRVGSDWQRIFHYGGTLVHDANNQPLMAIVTIADITEGKRVEQEIRQLNAELEEHVVKRTAQLEAANKELEAFSYSVSHDLRSPLRTLDGFSQAVLEDYGAQLPEEGRRYLQTIREGAQRMGVLIDDLLTFSRLSRLPLHKQTVETARLVRDSLDELDSEKRGRKIDIRLSELPSCHGDPALLKQVWINLLSNALKYTRNREAATVEIGCARDNGEAVYFVRDNGTGFDMKYAHKLFGVFQRLHRADEFEGTGVGLAIIQRIIHRHGGRIWAEAAIDRGATFHFTLEGENNV